MTPPSHSQRKWWFLGALESKNCETTNKGQLTSISHMFSVLLSGWCLIILIGSILLFAFFNTICLNMFLFCFTRSFLHWNTISERRLKNFYMQQHKQRWIKLSILFYTDKWKDLKIKDQIKIWRSENKDPEMKAKFYKDHNLRNT